MRTRFLLLPTMALATFSFAAPPAAPPPNSSAEAAAEAAASYSLGLTFGGQLHNGGLTGGLSMDALMQGIADGVTGKTVSQEDKQRAVMLLRSGKEGIALKNKSVARTFLSKNATMAGIVTTPSGLQYKILTPGNTEAASPKPADQVTVQYRGRLLNGTEFDSSYSRGQPASLNLNGVIKGWQEALTMMKPGAKWQLFVPPELAYDVNSPAAIPPGSLLIFDIELLKFGPPTAMPSPVVRQPQKIAPKS
jgi:FKBP-type peptidyl-prolyl cis-trans isomerase FklB